MSSILHTINQSPFEHKALEQCLTLFQDGDAIMLFGNGVYAALRNHPMRDALVHKPCYAIEMDLAARGLFQQPLMDHIQFVGYERFVELSTEYDLVQSWY